MTFYILTTSKAISLWAPNCDSAHSIQSYCIVLPHWDIQDVLVESVENGHRVREIVDSNSWSSQFNDM